MGDHYVGQVRERYIAGQLDLERFEHDLQAAILLDEGLLPDAKDVPRYLRDRYGHYLMASPVDLWRRGVGGAV